MADILSNNAKEVSKLFRAYGLYNNMYEALETYKSIQFQSSFELTGYITILQ